MATAITSNENNSRQLSSTFGDLSHDNVAVGGDYYLGDGLSESTLSTVLSSITGIANSAISSILTTSDKANNTVTNAYGEAYNDTRSTVAAFKPVMMWGAIALVGFLVLTKGGKKWI